MTNPINILRHSQPAKYQIKIQGRPHEAWSDWLDELEIRLDRVAEGSTITTLTGIVKDQSGLHGLLNRIRDLNIPLIAVQFINPIGPDKE
ncbi:MAG: hypothetical protein IH585_03920 [Anaerolineaceae bacterium]|nr:hypothetical protein [Anaerolineaceae bacterium]